MSQNLLGHSTSSIVRFDSALVGILANILPNLNNEGAVFKLPTLAVFQRPKTMVRYVV